MASGKMDAIGAPGAQMGGEFAQMDAATSGIVATLKAALSSARTLAPAYIRQTVVLARSALNPRQFSKPADRAELLRRLSANGPRYWSLYSLVGLVCLLYTILSSPFLILGIGLLAAAWAYAFMLRGADAPLDACGVQLRRREKLLVLVPFTLLVVTLTGMVNSLVYVGFCTACLSLPHASFHDNQPLDALDEFELEGLKGADFDAPGAGV